MIAYIPDDVSTSDFSAIFICKNIIYWGGRAAVYSTWFINRWNGRIALYKVTKNSLVKLHVSALRRFMLKWPIM